ncbi:hypothetical protein ACO0K3_02995 [Undibacterium sp. Rencai35W]|uniref:hypothetical protein n=1 Tax=Undibacterium sp. Rencai35W TaxID=3413046 RepID=UPI003BF2BF11
MTGLLDDFSQLVTLKSSEDLRQRPQYCPQLDPKQSELAEVLAPYHFGEPYPCGLSSCRTPHQSGYLVVTVDGKETNVGGICGRKIFGDSFTIKANLQEKRAHLKHQLDILKHVRDNKVTLLARIAEQLNRPTGVKWSEATLRSFKDALGQSVFKVLREKARRGDNLVEVTREASQEERDRHRVANPSARPLQSVAEKVGNLTGLDLLNHDPMRILTTLKDKLYALDNIDAKTLSPRIRKEWVDWANGIEGTFEEVEDVLANALRFYTAENLKIMIGFGSTPQEQMRLAMIQWSNSEMRLMF